ncbi:DUF177 domain-containing protein [Schaalia sp. 19OD2882]|uniref:YceD family protein n=1 Tax=Schaalia sp. 19OD2882 TaxID=2794089 RepID=UPI001C1EB47F|nr:YceD family protein [Schaalia sp. 19OD2882]QWW18905.1 DUF177 domain-containing protein [Schaalia sp. 19OD2882]
MSETALSFSLVDLPRQLGSRKQAQVDWTVPEDLGTPSMAAPPGRALPLDVEFTSVDNRVLVRLRTEVDLVGQCVRCLDPVVRHHRIDAAEVYFDADSPAARAAGSHDPMGEEDEAEEVQFIGPHDTIDLEGLVRDCVVTLVEDRPLCSPDCEGLCQGCGEKWVDLPADHQHVSIDPRLAGLAVLLQDAGLADGDRDAAPGDAGADTDDVCGHAGRAASGQDQ